MKNGDTFRGPRSFSRIDVSAIPVRPPMPEPIMTPLAQRSSSVAGCQPASSSACLAAHIAKMMKSSTLRWSLCSIHWSGLKEPLLPSPRGTTQAIRLVRSETSNVSIFRAPLSLLRMRFQVGSTPHPSGDTMPRPVTTTRLISSTPARYSRRHDDKPADRSPTVPPAQAAPGGASALRVFFEKFGCVAHRQNRLRGIIGNFTTEFLFKGHHELDRIETVGAEVINEARVVDHFFGFNTKVFDHDLLNSLANLTHRLTSCLCPLDPSPRRYEPSWPVNFPSQSRNLICPVMPDKGPANDAGSAPPIYRVSKSCKAYFAHPLVGSGIILPNP